MRHADDILFDDRAFIEVGGDVVSRGTDDFNTAIMSRVIGLGTGKCRQKRVMDVENAEREDLHKCGAENLHVARENNEIYIGRTQYLEVLRLGLGLARGKYWDVMERDAMAFSEGGVVGMIGQDQSNINRPFVAFRTG